MILKSAFSQSTPNALSSAISYSLSFPSGSRSFIPLTKFGTFTHSVKCSSISKGYNTYGAVNNQRSVAPKWTPIFKRVSFIDDSEFKRVASVLDQIEKEGKKLTKWDLCVVVKELRKCKRFKLALEVYEWMNNRVGRFKLSSSDAAIQLDLIAKTHGVSSAEDYFERIPDAEKDSRTYGALLNTYVEAKERDKAESLMAQMRNKGYSDCTLAFNVMMSLYLKFDEYDKIYQLISEMKRKNIRLNQISYNIWLSAHGSRGSVEGMELVLKQIKLDPEINRDWSVFSTMAAVFMKLGQIEKAEECLRNVETRIRREDTVPYQHLISLYSALGKKEEVYRVWSLYKLKLPRVRYTGYHVMISSLIRLGDIEGAEKLYQEWLQGKLDDARIGNLLMGWYIREEPFEKAKRFFDQMIQAGLRPNSQSWEILVQGHTEEGRIHDALSCFRKAVDLAKVRKTWKPQPRDVSAFLELCAKEGDTRSKDEFVGMLRELGCFEDTTFESIVASHTGAEVGDHDDQVMSGSKKKSTM